MPTMARHGISAWAAANDALTREAASPTVSTALITASCAMRLPLKSWSESDETKPRASRAASSMSSR